MPAIRDDFRQPLAPHWSVHQVGSGRVQPGGEGLLLSVTPGAGYHNAQICDYRYDDFRFAWNPPLRLQVTAQASAPAAALRGTAGFGFWNHPFSPDVKRPPRLPAACWFFFGSPPNDMRLALAVPGSGWKAASIDAGRPRALVLAPLAPAAALLLRHPGLYRRLYPTIQRRLGIAEALLDPALLAERHTYTLDWRADGLRFAVDGATVLQTDSAPRGRLGFIAWIDNQYAVVTPQGQFGFGVVPLVGAQWLRLDSVEIDSE
jgi:hypothetical protein